MALQAKPDCCQEAAILPPGFDAYIPCNKPATKVIGWKGRSDAPVRMCDMCAHHNVKNRGGYEVSVYPPPEVVAPQRVPLRTCAPPQNADYGQAVVEKYQTRLSAAHFAILMAAAGTDGSTRAIAAALNIAHPGTVKSRLHRARIEIAAMIAADKVIAASSAPSTVLGSG